MLRINHRKGKEVVQADQLQGHCDHPGERTEGLTSVSAGKFTRSNQIPNIVRRLSQQDLLMDLHVRHKKKESQGLLQDF